MCNFTFDQHPEVLRPIFEHLDSREKEIRELAIEQRLRLKVNVGPGTTENRQIFRGNQLQHSEPVTLRNIHVLNEVVIDRGPSPMAVQLNIYIEENFVTTANGDGLIISTPTGSTAYNLAAGGSIVETSAECVCMTPLAPHSISFRPLILHSSVEIRIEKV